MSGAVSLAKSWLGGSLLRLTGREERNDPRCDSCFLGKPRLFADCFRRPAGRLLLGVYVRGLLSNVLRKNVEALALAQRVGAPHPVAIPRIHPLKPPRRSQRGLAERRGTSRRSAFSASYLLLWIFTTTETLTRLPVGNPIAASPQDPTLLAVHFGLLVLFLVGFGYQVLRLRGAQPVTVPTQARA